MVYKNKNKKKKKRQVVKISVIFAIIFVLLSFIILKLNINLSSLITTIVPTEYDLVSKERIDIMKKQGCVYDGLLTPKYNAVFNESVNMLKRSKCKYIHRAVETWNISPNFSVIKKRMQIIKKQTGKDFIYGLFFAESVNISKSYYDPYSKKTFYFSKMCAPGTFGKWGKGTCVPSIRNTLYRQYLQAVFKRAIDSGVEDFTFGQIYYQDSLWKKDYKTIRNIIRDAKQYAKSKGKEISIGAQTNTMDIEEYLRSFDYITGGVGQNKKGEIEEENNSCWSYYYKRNGYCWALLWNEKYKSKTNNILLYLDWNNSYTDDIHRFTSMNRLQKDRFLSSAYNFFLWHNIGFLMPLGEVLGNVSSKCHGPTTEFYSASNRYSCKDESSINNILSGGDLLPNFAKFIGQEVPTIMKNGEIYQVTVSVQNTSFKAWKKERGFKLGSLSPQDNTTWGLARVEIDGAEVIGLNEVKNFVFNITAPAKPGTYDFQWGMIQEPIGGWFKSKSEKLRITVQ